VGYKRIDLLSDHSRHGIAVAVFCRKCGHFAELDAADLLRRGRRNLPPTALPFRCARCNARGDQIAVGKEARRLHSLGPKQS
jgi:hypothetical protein